MSYKVKFFNADGKVYETRRGLTNEEALTLVLSSKDAEMTCEQEHKSTRVMFMKGGVMGSDIFSETPAPWTAKKGLADVNPFK